MSRFVLATLAAVALASTTADAKTTKATLSGTFTATDSNDLVKCYNLIRDEGYGTDTCHSTFSGSSWSPSSPDQFKNSVKATMAFEGEDCNVSELKAAAPGLLGARCPGVTVNITSASSSTMATATIAVIGTVLVAAAAFF